MKISPQAVGKVKQEMGKYSSDKNGLMQAIADWGGMMMVDNACDFVKRSPKVSGLLKMANIDVNKIRLDLKGAPTNQTKLPSAPSYKERLNQLR